MIKITLKEVTDKLFNDSILGVLSLTPPAKLSYNLTKISKKIDKELVIYNSERIKLLKKYCKLDEKGELELKDQNAEFISPEHGVEFNKEHEDMLSIEFECHGIKLEDLECIKDLKGIYVTGLFPIILEE